MNITSHLTVNIKSVCVFIFENRVWWDTADFVRICVYFTQSKFIAHCDANAKSMNIIVVILACDTNSANFVQAFLLNVCKGCIYGFAILTKHSFSLLWWWCHNAKCINKRKKACKQAINYCSVLVLFEGSSKLLILRVGNSYKKFNVDGVDLKTEEEQL